MFDYSKREKSWIGASIVLAILLGAPGMEKVRAMHIMEGYLPLIHTVVWGALCVPFLVAGLIRIRKTVAAHRKTLLIFAMVGAYAFVLSALKIPSVTGSSSHPTGIGLGAILVGPTPMAVLGIIVLLFQAILLAHGGLTTLGANTFSMAIVGAFVSYGLYHLLKKLKVNQLVSIFIAAALGNLMTYVVTSVQLALAHPASIGGVMGSFTEFLGIFALTQVPLAIIEGILTVIVVMGLQKYAKPELRELSLARGGI